jgi:peptide methionine sulfoxide reductase MsrB
MFINPKLSPKEISIIVHKAIEMPFSGKFNTHNMDGVYFCKNCGTALYRSDDKFNSGCAGHLGHVFKGEEFESNE